MKLLNRIACLTAILMLSVSLTADGKRIVTLQLELPNGARPQLKGLEGDVVSVEFADGKFGFVPAFDAGSTSTVHVTVYDLLAMPHKSLGSVDVTVGGNSVKTDTAPAFVVSVTEVKTP